MKKIGKQSILNVMNLFMKVKSMLKYFGFIKPLLGFYDREILLLDQQWTFFIFF